MTTGVRPVEPRDLGRLAEIHIAVVGHAGTTRERIHEGYERVLPELLADPIAAHASPPLVYEEDGAVVGSVLVTCHPVVLCGERAWLACTSHLGVLPEARASMAALHLLRAVAAGPQDLTYADRSNEAGRVALRAAGFEQFPAYSLRWRKVLRRGVAVTRRAADRLPVRGGLLVAAAARAESLLPSRARRTVVPELPPVPTVFRAVPLSVDHVTAAGPGLVRRFDLHPDFGDAGVVERAERLLRRVRPHGTLLSRAVLSRRDDVVGWYVVHIDEREVAEVLQFVAEVAHQRSVMLQMFHELRARDVVAAEGELPLRLLYDAEALGCRIDSRDATTSVHTADERIVECFRNGTAFLTQLEGEYVANPTAAAGA